MPYSDELTEEEYKNIRINQEVVRYLEWARNELGLEKQEMNVLDWGCGRGNYVLFLRSQGYNAFGVDTSLDCIDRGKGLMERMGFDPDQLISLIGPDCKTQHPDAFFHFVFSCQVLEHVEHIDLVTRESNRITKSGCFGLHIYPGNRRPIEGHLFMPLVHWLPKNSIRKFAIRLFVFCRIEPRWPALDGLGSLEKADVYFEYSRDKSFYRPYETICNSFVQAGFSVKPVVLDHPGLLKFRWIPNKLLEALVLRFRSVELLARKQAAFP
jgi:hypothetical protein